ncbi:MAG: DUF115 domain-containing protein [Treponema sp.]|jgi:uncharacterized Rossmann fold enzyme|nr:DUF115 domain-containing protein [Treponema sp.]
MSDEPPRQCKARRGFSISYKGKTLLSRIDPIAQGERLAKAVPLGGGILYFCPSPLYGYGIEWLLGHVSPDSAILCVELDEKLFALSRKAMEDILKKNPALSLLSGSGDPARLCGWVQNTWGSRRFRRIEILRLSGGWQLYEEQYANLADALRRNIAIDWGNAMTLMKMGRRYIRNAIRNLALIPQAPSLRDCTLGASPVLVLGAGPSLDGVLEGLHRCWGTDLSEISRPFKIIGVDTCLQPLKDWNIKPDLVVALESQHWNLRDFIGMGSWDIPLAMDLSALPATREVLGGHPRLFATPWTRLRLFKRLASAKLLPETFPPLGSVGLTAVALARRLSTGPIIIGGMDFAFTLDRFHARSTPGHWEGLSRQTRFRSILMAETAFRPGTGAARSKAGLSQRTDPVMKTYRDLFEQEFAKDPRIHDITGLGLPLGLRSLSLERALAVLGKGLPSGSGGVPKPRHTGEAAIAAAVDTFICRERDALMLLRDILTGNRSKAPENLEALLDEGDYLWAHFPECAGAEGRRPSGTDLSFLKRVRIEIDPLVKLFDLTLQEVRSYPSTGSTW